MNITVLANRDLASNFALNRLLPALAPRHQLSVFLSARVGGSAEVPAPLKELKFFEQSLFNTLLFPALEGSDRSAHLYSFDELARQTGANIAVLNKINSVEGLEVFAATRPDLVLSIRYGGILREKAIAIPRLGVLNLHSGLLPDYRGVMATFYAMLNGEVEIGTSLHTIVDPGIDTGEILAHTRRPIDHSHSYLWNVLQLYPAGVDAMLAAVKEIAEGVTPVRRAQAEAGHYYSFPDSGQLQQFHQEGFTLYDVGEVLEFAQYYLEL